MSARPSIVWCRWVVTSSYVRPVFAISSPGAPSRASDVRSAPALKPVFEPSFPARVRPYPRCRVAEFSACPGRIQTGASIERPR